MSAAELFATEVQTLTCCQPSPCRKCLPMVMDLTRLLIVATRMLQGELPPAQLGALAMGSALPASERRRGKYRCSLCRRPGHNATTCKDQP